LHPAQRVSKISAFGLPKRFLGGLPKILIKDSKFEQNLSYCKYGNLKEVHERAIFVTYKYPFLAQRK
jgi:hypothetical protein